MEKPIYTQAQELKAILQTALLPLPLLAFAEKFATDPLLITQAFNLDKAFNETEDANQKEALKTPIMELIDQIVEDYLNSEAQTTIEYFRPETPKPMETNLQKARQAQVVFEGVNIGKKYKKNDFQLAGVDLSLKIGEITGVVGENGNGKTTLFRICVGDLQPSQGDICYPYLNQLVWNYVNWYEVKQNIAFIPQELPKWYGSLYNNLALEASLFGFRGKHNVEAVQNVANRLDLDKHLDKTWGEISGGYKLRFALAKALIRKPKLLVLDEPLANLDINAQTVILNTLRQLIESRVFPVSILISSQHLHEIERIADNLLYLKEGKEIYNGKTAEFGSERMENCFELECGLSQAVFEQLMKGFAYHSVENTGLVLIIRTPLYIQEKELLQHLLAQDVKINYFRNISQSIKKYFV
ncbi:MAG: ABC transporter ATP-binding protein [Microscillaceae bacterium]|nr:ABC transporter ATP-binding protein [Microscillaceae bacterium]